MNKKYIMCSMASLFIVFSSLSFAQDREVKVISVKYQDVRSLEKVLNAIKSTEGKIAVYPDSNTVILNDHSTRIRQMEKVIRQIDVKKEQVGITVTIVELADDLVRLGTLPFSSGIISRGEFDKFIYMVKLDDASAVRSESRITTLSGRPAVLQVVDEIMAGGYFTRGERSDIYHEPYEINAGITHGGFSGGE